MKKLLNKSIRPLIVYALIVITLSIPVYFYIINKIWVSELDEHHKVTKQKIEKQFNNLNQQEPQLSEAIQLWNTLQHGVRIKSVDASTVKPDRFYTNTRFDEYHNDEEQFRGLESYITINNKPYQVIIETNMEEVDETVIAVATVALGFFLVLLIGFIVLNRQLSRRIWKPFYSTIGRLKTFDIKGNSDIKLDKTDTLEFDQLNQVVNELINSNVSAYQQQKEFTENASHELQTPLAIIKSKLDLLMQDETLSKEQSEVIESINLTLSRASRINRNLLLLAKIENQQFDLTESVDLSQLISENVELLSEHIENKSIGLKTSIEPNVKTSCNRSLLEILITNLLLNAIRHSPDQSRMKIELTGRSLKISNSGATSLNTENLFKRFISASTETPNSGLGLSIVKQISNRFGWNVAYSFENNFHIFSVSFS